MITRFGLSNMVWWWLLNQVNVFGYKIWTRVTSFSTWLLWTFGRKSWFWFFNNISQNNWSNMITKSSFQLQRYRLFIIIHELHIRKVTWLWLVDIGQPFSLPSSPLTCHWKDHEPPYWWLRVFAQANNFHHGTITPTDSYSLAITWK